MITLTKDKHEVAIEKLDELSSLTPLERVNFFSKLGVGGVGNFIELMSTGLAIADHKYRKLLLMSAMMYHQITCISNAVEGIQHDIKEVVVGVKPIIDVLCKVESEEVIDDEGTTISGLFVYFRDFIAAVGGVIGTIPMRNAETQGFFFDPEMAYIKDFQESLAFFLKQKTIWDAEHPDDSQMSQSSLDGDELMKMLESWTTERDSKENPDAEES